jgi:hypothetical protein
MEQGNLRGMLCFLTSRAQSNLFLFFDATMRFQSAIRVYSHAYPSLLLLSSIRRFTKIMSPDALVLPVFPNDEFSQVPSKFASSINAPVLWTATNANASKALETRVFHQENGPTLSLVALGKDAKTVNAKREAARKAVATGVKAARDAGARSIAVVSDQIGDHDAGKIIFVIFVDHLTSPSAVAATLSLFDFTLQTKPKDPVPTLESISNSSTSKKEDLDWATGTLYAEGQNLAREVHHRDISQESTDF